MKALKKVLVVAVCAALTLTAMPQTEAEAAPGVLATYSFDTTDGMTDPGYGTLPSIVSDPERGNVLEFADGESSTYKTDTGNAKGVHKCEVVVGSPSAYEIPNPYDGTGLTSMTFSYWVKVTNPEATSLGAGILGWVSPEYTTDHPDAKAGEKTQDEVGWYEVGSYIFGANVGLSDVMTSEIPMLNFAGLYHNWYCYWNEGIDLADSAWHHVIVTTDSSHANTKVYFDGVDLFTNGGFSDLGKRFNHGEKDATNKANTLELTLMEVIGMSGTKLYLGHTGSNPTCSGVFVDDVTFYDGMVTDAEALSMYNDAKAAPTITGGGEVSNESTNQEAGNDSNNSGNSTQQTDSKVNSGNKNSQTTNTPNLPQTGVMSTAALVGIGVAVIGAGSVLLKKKEK